MEVSETEFEEMKKVLREVVVPEIRALRDEIRAIRESLKYRSQTDRKDQKNLPQAPGFGSWGQGSQS